MIQIWGDGSRPLHWICCLLCVPRLLLAKNVNNARSSDAPEVLFAKHMTRTQCLSRSYREWSYSNLMSFYECGGEIALAPRKYQGISQASSSRPFQASYSLQIMCSKRLRMTCTSSSWGLWYRQSLCMLTSSCGDVSSQITHVMMSLNRSSRTNARDILFACQSGEKSIIATNVGVQA